MRMTRYIRVAGDAITRGGVERMRCSARDKRGMIDTDSVGKHTTKLENKQREEDGTQRRIYLVSSPWREEGKKGGKA